MTCAVKQHSVASGKSTHSKWVFIGLQRQMTRGDITKYFGTRQLKMELYPDLISSKTRRTDLLNCDFIQKTGWSSCWIAPSIETLVQSILVIHIRGLSHLAMRRTSSPKVTGCYPIGSMGLVYLPTWMVDSHGFHVGKYTIHGSYGYYSEPTSWNCQEDSLKRLEFR